MSFLFSSAQGQKAEFKKIKYQEHIALCSRSYPGCRVAFLQQKLPWLPCGIFAAEVTLAAVWHFCSRSYPGCCMAFLQQKLPWLPCGIFAAEVTLAAMWHFCSRSYPGCCLAFLQQKLPWLLSGIFAAKVSQAAASSFQECVDILEQSLQHRHSTFTASLCSTTLQLWGGHL